MTGATPGETLDTLAGRLPLCGARTLCPRTSRREAARLRLETVSRLTPSCSIAALDDNLTVIVVLRGGLEHRDVHRIGLLGVGWSSSDSILWPRLDAGRWIPKSLTRRRANNWTAWEFIRYCTNRRTLDEVGDVAGPHLLLVAPLRLQDRRRLAVRLNGASLRAACAGPVPRCFAPGGAPPTAFFFALGIACTAWPLLGCHLMSTLTRRIWEPHARQDGSRRAW